MSQLTDNDVGRPRRVRRQRQRVQDRVPPADYPDVVEFWAHALSGLMQLRLVHLPLENVFQPTVEKSGVFDFLTDNRKRYRVKIEEVDP